MMSYKEQLETNEWKKKEIRYCNETNIIVNIAVSPGYVVMTYIFLYAPLRTFIIILQTNNYKN